MANPRDVGGFEAVLFRGVEYLSLDTLARLAGGAVSFGATSASLRMQYPRIVAPDGEWQFPNGGDRMISASERRETKLRHLMLTIGGRHFVALADVAPYMGLQVAGSGPRWVRRGDRNTELKPEAIDCPHWRHRAALAVTHDVRVTTRELVGLRSLQGDGKKESWPAGTSLLVRRRVTLDGQAFALAHRCDHPHSSSLLRADELDEASVSAGEAHTRWGELIRWFRQEALAERALLHGEREELPQTVCVTVDLCWSDRHFEESFFRGVAARGVATGRRSVTLFPSGRWIEQHPLEMHALIELGREGGLEITWGLHSWAHPKTNEFLNVMAQPELSEDTLRMEQTLLEWGIVPSVYFRFPGLVHDRERLEAVLDLGVLPIDCDVWVARSERGAGGPFAGLVRSGSVLLVHGNGNEPEGIPPLMRWMDSHPEWRFGRLEEFLPGFGKRG